MNAKKCMNVVLVILLCAFLSACGKDNKVGDANGVSTDLSGRQNINTNHNQSLEYYRNKVANNQFVQSSCLRSNSQAQEVFYYNRNGATFDRANGYYERKHEEAGGRSATEQTVRDRLISLFNSSTSYDAVNDNVVGVIINNSIYYIDFRYPLFANPIQHENRDTNVLYRFSRADCF